MFSQVKVFVSPCFLILIFLLIACNRNSAKIDIPRADPGYMGWLSKQSILAQAPELIAQVSQSGRVWLQGSEPGRITTLLKAAPNWLLLDENLIAPPFFRSILPEMATAKNQGFSGVYLGATGERPDIWLSGANNGPTQNPASLNFDSKFGSDADFENMAQAAEKAGLELGATLLPGATGQGPDFVLQARGRPEHSGLYAMLPASPELDASLPIPQAEWDCQALDKQQIAELIKAGALPSGLGRDSLSWPSPGGWAVTGSVIGADGIPRRWLYRYSENVHQPVVAWQDPSGQAAKAFAAAIIRQTGLLGIALTGISIEPLMALEPSISDSKVNLSPGIDALNEISRQIHRYGGWAMQADAVPEEVIIEALNGSCDFCRDDLTEALVIFGLLAADGRPLAQLYRDRIAQKLSISRLARGLNSNGIKLRLLNGETYAPILAKIRENGLTEKNWLSKLNGNPEAIEKFIFSWRLGMPGLVFSKNNSQNPWLANLMRNRAAVNLAQGEVTKVIRGQGGGFGLLTNLPEGGYWLLACNFGVNGDYINIELPKAVKNARDATTEADLSANLQANIFKLALDGRIARNVILH